MMEAEKNKKIGCLAAIGGFLFSMCVIILIFIMIVIISAVQSANPHRDSDKRSADQRMTEYYGEEFTLVSTDQRGGEEDITVWTLHDSKGNECSAVSKLIMNAPGNSSYYYFDDYGAVLKSQTPAMQRLLAQTKFPVRYEFNTISHDFSKDSDSHWIIEVENFEDIPDALHLALDTVTAEDSLLPEVDGSRTIYWHSMQPFVQLGVQEMGVFPFDTQENAAEYDFDALLTDAQHKFCDWCRENGQADKIPDEMTLEYPPDGVYQMQTDAGVVKLPLDWDAEQNGWLITGENASKDAVSLHGEPYLIDVLRRGEIEVYQYDRGDFYHYNVSYRNHDIILWCQSGYGIYEIARGSNTIGDSTHAFVRMTEEELQKLFGITFEADPLTMTGTLHYAKQTPESEPEA